MLSIQPGLIINKNYRIDRLLGSGGMADVYVVTHTRMPKQFALKIMRLDGEDSGLFLERFKREGDILASLKNDHIVGVVDCDQLSDGRPYLVMELLEGEDLSSYLHRNKVIPLEIALSITGQIGRALLDAHSAGVVHRDLKPSNLFKCRKGPITHFVKILDFGIAKQAPVGDVTQVTMHTTVIGSPGYMAPEQVMGQLKHADARTDQFALATILYEMLAGRPAFYGKDDSVYTIMERTVYREPAALTGYDASIVEAIRRGMRKRPEERFPTLAEFLSALGHLTEIQGTGQIPVVPAVSPISQADKFGELRRRLQESLVIHPFRIPVRIPIPVAGLVLLGGLGITMGWCLSAPKTVAAVKQTTAPIAAPPQPKPLDVVQGGPSIAQRLPTKPTPPTISREVDEQKKTQLPQDVLPKDVVLKKDLSESKSPSSGKRTYTIVESKSLKAPQGDGIRKCLNAYVIPMKSISGSIIKLSRSGHYHVMEGPPEVMNSPIFRSCITDFSSAIPTKELLETVTIHLWRQ